jgi:hypothetical protein
MRSCHREQAATAGQDLPVFATPLPLDPSGDLRVASVDVHTVPSPHAAPPPRRPAAPS